VSAAALRLVFFGTPEFAVPSLRRLQAGPHDVVLVVSQPDRPRGRGRKRTPSPVAQVALDTGVALLRPEKVGAPEAVAQIEAARPDVGVVVAFGQFLPRRVRELPSRGYLINAHASLLPAHRGAAPAAHALLRGDRETGISVMRVEREMDAGPVARVVRTPIAQEETRGELEERLARLAADALAAALDDIADGRIEWVEQDASRATEAPKIGREDARLELAQPASELARRVRAMAPQPGASVLRRGEPLRLLGARADDAACADPPGTVRLAADGSVRVATARGWLVPTRLQRAGASALGVREFQRGRGLVDGEVLGSTT
jgi:methionyl-tRNA formyltransferase